MRLKLSLQQAEILSDAAKFFSEKSPLTEDQTIALKQATTLLNNNISSEIDSNDLKFESMIETLVDQGKYIGLTEDLVNIHQNIKEQNSLRKNKYEPKSKSPIDFNSL